MLKIKLLLLLVIPYFVFANDLCIYRFYTDGPIKGNIKIKIIGETKENYKISLIQEIRTTKNIKEFIVKKNIKPKKFINEILKITSNYNKDKIKIISQKIDENFVYKHFENKYPGVKISAIALIGNKKYELSYVLSEKIPILHLLEFSIKQHVKSRKEYDLDNRIILKEYTHKGKLKKL